MEEGGAVDMHGRNVFMFNKTLKERRQTSFHRGVLSQCMRTDSFVSKNSLSSLTPPFVPGQC